jgi:cell fate regulator YaaT (PSP1 superfamily)
MDEQNKAPTEASNNPHKKKHRSRHRSHHKPNPNRDAQTAEVSTQRSDAPEAKSAPNAESGETAKKNNRPSHGRNRHKHHNRPNGTEVAENAPKKPEGESAPRQNQQDQKGQHKKKRNKKSSQHGNRGLVDLYGNPTENDVLTMEELRAKIVLQAADGSIPATAASKPAPVEESVEPLTEEFLKLADEDFTPQPIPVDERVEVVGIRFRSAGKVYYFDPKSLKVRIGDSVIVETARGPEFGEVSFGNRFIHKTSTVSPLRPVLRVATKEDVLHNEKNREMEKEALKICQEKVTAHKLDMNLIDAQYAFDNSKLLFYFTSEGRVDFRELVKDLAHVFHTRIELRQIGIRDEAKMLGGLGACGRPLCCASFLSDFAQVSIKMAKDQGLSLNSAKISGVCGRLMCCLRYESEVYSEALKRLPAHDATVKTPDGIGYVMSVSPLAETIRVGFKNSDTPPKTYPASELVVLGKGKAAEEIATEKSES